MSGPPGEQERTMIFGRLIAESLRLDANLAVPSLSLRSIRRQDVASSTSPEQPNVWTLVDFEAPSELAGVVADALASVLSPEGGWYADYSDGDEHVIVFAGRVFRYRKGDAAGRAAAQAHGRTVGVPEHQLDWGD